MRASSRSTTRSRISRDASIVDLSSWGAGLSLAGFGGLQSTLIWAYPLVPSDNVAVGDSRLHFQVRYGF
jgi:hypothetical protein